MTTVGIIVLKVTWTFVMAYAWYRIVLAVFGRYNTRRHLIDALVAGSGGAVAVWGRVLYETAEPSTWPFALTVFGVALMVGPKLVGIAEHADS